MDLNTIFASAAILEPSCNLLPERQLIRHPVRRLEKDVMPIEEAPILLAKDICHNVSLISLSASPTPQRIRTYTWAPSTHKPQPAHSPPPQTPP